MTKNQNWKSFTNREKFLFTIQEMNGFFSESSRISKKEAANLYDNEIAPYGYLSHQKFLLGQAMISHAFNQNVVNGKYKKYQNAPTTGEVFAKQLLPAYYITDSLAHSLFNTDIPSDNNFIGQIISLDILPMISIVFSNEFSLGEDVCSNLCRLSITKEEKQLSIQVFSGKKMGQACYAFHIPFVENGYDQLSAAREDFLENNIGDRIIFRSIAMDLCQNGGVGEKRIKLAEDCVKNFYIETLPKIYKFVINLLCLMTQQPELISVQKSSTKYVAASNKGFSSHKVNNVPNVHWLGADFTTKVQYSKEIGSELIDISRGKPKKSHWRRGHWHTILQGPGRLQKRMKWFQPVFIKGNKQSTLAEEN